MARRESSKDRETALVVGFNARPIAASAKRCGLRVLAVDYWGDTDLTNSADDTETVLKQVAGERPRRELSKPAPELLADCALTICSRHPGEASFALVGSGLDDRPDLWKKIAEIVPVLGNSMEALNAARDRFKLYETASKLGISSPVTMICSNLDQVLNASSKIGYPVVMKPSGGGGGVGIRLASTESELRSVYLEEWRPRFGESVFLQEYVKGENVSASVMGDGEKSVIVSVNEQLIGIRELGARAPFVWCGNVVPLQRSKREADSRAICAAAEGLSDHLKLTGSNGFDFVLRREDKSPIIIECNPRFQGTLECVEMATGINLVREHIEACRGKMKKKFPETKRYVTKMIPFAKSRCMTGDLGGITGVRDISPTGMILEQGDPVCTVHRVGNSKAQSIQKARESVAEIYRRLTPEETFSISRNSVR
jgi:hypothetical protein